MSDLSLPPPSDLAAALERLRADGAAVRDPAGWWRIEALARRAAGHQGAVRQLLDQRLAQWVAASEAQSVSQSVSRSVEACGRSLDAEPAAGELAAAPTEAGPPALPQRSALAGLLAHIATQALKHPAGGAAGPSHGLPSLSGLPQPLPELKTVRQHRATWARLGAERRLAQSRSRVPDNAGPLNTQRLLHQALSAMGEASPGCLQHFVAHVEALLWLDQSSLPREPRKPVAGGGRRSR